MIKVPSIHLNTEFSLLESTIKIDSLIDFAIRNQLKELVITDRNNMYGVADFIFKAKKAGIKPVIGIDLDVEKYRFVLLAKNYDGYKELMRLSSLKEFGKEIKIKDIKDLDLFVIDHPSEGFFAFENRKPNFTNFFVGSKTLNEADTVWFNETKIFSEEENIALDILSSINGKDKKNTFEPLKINFDEKDARVQQVRWILDQCNIVFPKNLNPLPEYKIETGENKLYYIKKLLINSFNNLKIDKTMINQYKKRVNYELDIVNKLGYIDYFLIIADFISWAKSKKIAIGPGRGSAAGSLISFLLGITEVDPIKFELLFERFLNPERISMPDIDIDIQDNRRDDVIKYIINKYGKSHVALISTFSKIGAKTALRDVARIMNMPLRDVDSLSKMIDASLTLKESYEKIVKFRAAIDKTEKTRELFKKAKMIEGLPRQKGTHAAGIVISDINIVKKVPITQSVEKLIQTQYTMNHLESHGLLKIDLLGLRNLTTIELISKEILNNFNKKINLKKIPLNDEVTNNLLNDGDTNGIFQLESHGMKNTLKQVGVSNFDDLVSIISLFRPGPMEFISEFTKVKNNQLKIENIHPIYDEIVKPTRGIIVFQEQIMLLAQKLSGMSFGQADILRRAISKKKKSLINELKDKFINGTIKNGVNKEKAEEIYNKIEKFANYGFNKSHAVSYGILAYRLSFLKARFPFEFYISLIKSSIGSQTQIKKYVNEAKRKKINIVAPSVMESSSTTYSKNKSIILPLVIIKGFGEAANKKIMDAKEKFKKFDDFFDFVSKVKIFGLGDAQIQTLILANALRDFGNMNTLINSLSSAIRYSEMTLEKSDNGLKFSNIQLPKPLLIESDKDLNFEMNSENKAFGFNILIFPTVEKELKTNLSNLKIDKPEYVVALVNSIKKLKDKNNKNIGIIKLSDSNTTIEAMAFAETFKFIEDSKKNIIINVKLVKKEYKGNDTYRVVEPWKEI